MSKQITGIHHVTAIASDPQRNVDFYAGVLGMRLVKKTVNFDDPGTYHFYFGDEIGHPGTILTFFPIPRAFQGSRGAGQAAVTALSIPAGSLGYWVDRLKAHNVKMDEVVSRFGEDSVAFYDPDDLLLELVAHEGSTPGEAWDGSPVPAEHTIRGVHHVRLDERQLAPTETLLTGTMGFQLTQTEGNLVRYEVGDGSAGAIVDILHAPNAREGRVAAGTVHHVAFRTPDDNAQDAWRHELLGLGYHVSPVMDRSYFHSIYYREPGGVLFEIATDTPGFLIDEATDSLGMSLKLPTQYEHMRDALDVRLPKISVPQKI